MINPNNSDDLKLKKSTIHWVSVGGLPEFFAQARRKRWEHFLVYERVSPQAEPGLFFSVVASKKGVDKKAVLRNRAKRRLRAAVYAAGIGYTDLWQQKHVEWVFMANRSSLKCTYGELTAAIEAVMVDFSKRQKTSNEEKSGGNTCS